MGEILAESKKYDPDGIFVPPVVSQVMCRSYSPPAPGATSQASSSPSYNPLLDEPSQSTT